MKNCIANGYTKERGRRRYRTTTRRMDRMQRSRHRDAEGRRGLGHWALVALGVGAGMLVSQLLAAGADRRLIRIYNAGNPPDPYSDPDAYRDEVTAIQQTTVGAPSDEPLGDESIRRRIPGVPTHD
jgi:hypothetical protein